MKLLLSLYLFVALGLTQLAAAYFYLKGKTNYRTVFLALTLCISLYLFGYLMILNSHDLREVMFWNQFQYVGLPFIPVLWFLMALFYTKTIDSAKGAAYQLLFLAPTAAFIVRLTNSWHNLFYTSWEMKEYFDYYTPYMGRGPWFYVNILYVIISLLWTILIYARYYKHRSNRAGSPFPVFLFASFLPLAGVLITIFAHKRFSTDFAALVMPISLLIIAYGIFKHDFLEIRTLARETVFENNYAGMLILEPELKIIDYNKAAKEFFQALSLSLDTYPLEEILLREPELMEILKSDVCQEYSLVIDGEERFFEIDTLPLGNSEGKDTRTLKSIRDITEKRKIEQTLRVLATTDSLSGLYNRAEFTRLAHREFKWAKIRDQELSLLMVDLDGFKALNDTYGHAAGDEAIRQIGSILLSKFRKTDIAGRIGGEEFAVLMKNASLKDAQVAAEKFRDTVDRTKVAYRDREISLTVSIGVASSASAESASGVEDVLRQADDALYIAKAKGRNCVAVWGEAQPLFR